MPLRVKNGFTPMQKEDFAGFANGGGNELIAKTFFTILIRF
jgi:hypothetical protein